MPITYGLTTTGFTAKSADVVRQDENAAAAAKFGTSIDTSDGAFLGVLFGILAERYGSLWDLAQAVAASQDPDQATGAALDALCLLTGTFRTAAKASTATLTLTGTNATVVAAGSRASTNSTNLPFATSISATLSTLTTWLTATVYSVGQRVTNAGNSYQCAVGGTSITGPTGTTASGTRIFVDGAGPLTWRFLGVGAAAVDVAASAVATGATVAVSGDISVISTPVGGWVGVDNVLDAVLGNDVQTDASLRVARIVQLSAPGTGTQNAIRAALLSITGVTSATVFVNNTDTVNVDSMPPHSVEALVLGGANADIAAVLFAQVAGGIAFQGTTSTTVTDSQGTAQTVKFSRPTQIPIYAQVTLTKDPSAYPSNGDAQVALAVATYGAKQLVGKDAVAASVGAQAFTVAGVLDVPRAGSLQGALISIAPSPTSDATIVITSRQLAVWDTSRVVVISSNGTP